MEKGNVQRIIMDMDPGIDDALALILASNFAFKASLFIICQPFSNSA
jgi:inosine-uridine nucleoside N-ribohydrolase